MFRVKNNELTNWRRSGVFIVNFEHISHLVLVSFLLTLSMLILTRSVLQLLNARLIFRRCLSFLMGLMAQNPKRNRILYSGKACLCSFYHCKKLTHEKIVMLSYSSAYRYTNALHYEKRYYLQHEKSGFEFHLYFTHCD